MKSSFAESSNQKDLAKVFVEDTKEIQEKIADLNSEENSILSEFFSWVAKDDQRGLEIVDKSSAKFKCMFLTTGKFKFLNLVDYSVSGGSMV